MEQRETRYRGTELKFLVDGSAADAIRQWARRQTLPDPHAGGPHGDEYHTTTIYLDTQALDVYWRRRSYGRSKLRIRRYGDAGHAFVERKLRTGCVLANDARWCRSRISPGCRHPSRRTGRAGGSMSASGRAG